MPSRTAAVSHDDAAATTEITIGKALLGKRRQACRYRDGYWRCRYPRSLQGRELSRAAGQVRPMYATSCRSTSSSSSTLRSAGSRRATSAHRTTDIAEARAHLHRLERLAEPGAGDGQRAGSVARIGGEVHERVVS